MPGPGSRSSATFVVLLNTVTESWSALARATRFCRARSAMGVEWLWATADRASRRASNRKAQVVARMVRDLRQRARRADQYVRSTFAWCGRLPENDRETTVRLYRLPFGRQAVQRLTHSRTRCKLPIPGRIGQSDVNERPPARPAAPAHLRRSPEMTSLSRSIAVLAALALVPAALRAQAPLHSWYGDLPGDFFGWANSGVGDMNHDGYDDVVMGAPLGDPGGMSSGYARVYSGKDGSVIWHWEGQHADDKFGQFASDTGDVNNDGWVDVAISVP